jgi:8-oxo-dGTP diphosphatase
MQIYNFPAPIIGVGGIVFNEHDQILLIQRSQRPALHLWSVPGGRQEPGESLAEACEREILEETGIAVKAVSIVAVVERRIEEFHYVIIDFLATLQSCDYAQPQAGGDAAQAKWVDIQQLKNYPLVETLQEIIMRVCNARSNALGLQDWNDARNDYILPL